MLPALLALSLAASPLAAQEAAPPPGPDEASAVVEPGPTEPPTPDLSLEAVHPEEPVPAQGAAGGRLQVTGYVLPPADVAWFADGRFVQECLAAWSPAGASVSGPCPEPMAPAVLRSLGAWEVAAEAPQVPPETLPVAFVARYDPTVQVITVHAEVDPGRAAAFEGYRGPPGIQLVRPAELRKEVRPRLPRAARDLGVDGCDAQLLVDPEGRPRDARLLDCPDPLQDAAARALVRTRWYPRVVDGITAPEQVEVRVRFKGAGGG